MSQGEYFLAAAIIIRKKENFIITQRHPQKSAGLKWEFPGGGVQAGEDSLCAAKRELLEETGLDMPLNKFHLLGRMLFPSYQMFMDLYEIHVDIEREDLTLQEGETIDARVISYEELEQFYFELAPIDQKLFDRYVKKEQ